MTVRDTFVHELKVDLTERDLADIAEEIAAQQTELGQARDRLDIAKAAFKRCEKAISADLEQAVRDVQQGWAIRDVTCYGRRNLADGTFEFVRASDDTVVDTRPLRPDERQAELALEATEGGDTWWVIASRAIQVLIDAGKAQ